MLPPSRRRSLHREGRPHPSRRAPRSADHYESARVRRVARAADRATTRTERRASRRAGLPRPAGVQLLEGGDDPLAGGRRDPVVEQLLDLSTRQPGGVPPHVGGRPGSISATASMVAVNASESSTRSARVVSSDTVGRAGVGGRGRRPSRRADRSRPPAAGRPAARPRRRCWAAPPRRRATSSPSRSQRTDAGPYGVRCRASREVEAGQRLRGDPDPRRSPGSPGRDRRPPGAASRPTAPRA